MTYEGTHEAEGGEAHVTDLTGIAAGPDDPRQYVRISVDLPTNIKINSMSDPLLAISATVIAICTSAASFTDGHVPINALRRSGVTETIIKEMIQEGIWHDDTDGCGRCPVPKVGRIYIHDYLRHQRSAEMVKNLKKERSKNGHKGAAARWSKHRAKQAEERAKAEAAATKAASKSGGDAKTDVAVVDPKRAEVIAAAARLCEYMADLIEKNHSQGKRPAIGDAWINDMRKMIELDDFTKEQLGALIRWTQRHHFWADNIRSPFKLREQQKKKDLYGQMLREQGELPSPGGSKPNSATKALSLAEELDRRHGGGQTEIAA